MFIKIFKAMTTRAQIVGQKADFFYFNTQNPLHQQSLDSVDYIFRSSGINDKDCDLTITDIRTVMDIYYFINQIFSIWLPEYYFFLYSWQHFKNMLPG